MSYKLFFLTLLFLLTINTISANQSRRLLQTTTEQPDETHEPFDFDGADNDVEGTEGTDEGTDTDNGTDTDDGNDIEDDTEDTGEDTGDDTENNTADDDEDNGEEDGDEDADDNTETTSQDEDIDGEHIDDEIDINSEDEIDFCFEISSEECGDEIDDDSDPLCAYNEEKYECFSIVRKAGSLGHGNYDDGYNAAQQNAVQDHDELNKVIGILGGLIGVLLLIIIGGIYWIWKNNSKKSNENTMEFVNDEHDKVPMVQK